MGILNALFRMKTRSIVEYRFIEIGEDTVSPHIAKNFKEMLDATKSFCWDSEDFYWHKYDDPESSSKKSSIVWNAKFVEKDDSQNELYVDSGVAETGETMFFLFTVAPSDNSLWISVRTGDELTHFSALVLLERE